MRLARRLVECTARDRDHYGRIVAVSCLAGEDLNAWMVAQGWVLVAYRTSLTDYVSHVAGVAPDGAPARPWEPRRKRWVSGVGGGEKAPVNGEHKM